MSKAPKAAEGGLAFEIAKYVTVGSCSASSSCWEDTVAVPELHVCAAACSLQNTIRAKDRELDVARKEVTTLKSHLSTSQRWERSRMGKQPWSRNATNAAPTSKQPTRGL